ncbi:hypothetical protein GCM10025868_21250 [Angustibacter aerolatus]|uniref:Glycosyltransferase RgtA/B/C/D-like domain-containing protein n=1 Tax=Angustibacter aerolatus TaxID=1162965 RepID=A0ABQ6JJ77_9ACTN|nr:glycosyltransferase family 39 protein [Angustibacter aerolatus]GMA86875.1 hypothetical protein GCM10025868_21250 [Angustibacter aerolatus]
MPQALMGVATVAVLHATVKRVAGAAAGLLAGLVLALTPVAALMFRFDNPDALLVLVLTLGAWMTLRACERGRARWLVLAGAMVGLGFLTKQPAGVPRAAGFRPRLPRRRPEGARTPGARPAAGVRRDGARGRLVGRGRRAGPGLDAALRRRLAEQLVPRA